MKKNMFAHIYDAREALFGTDREDALARLLRDLREPDALAPPRFLMFKVTNRCNSGCVYCGYAHNQRHGSADEDETLPLPSFLNVLDQAASLGVESIAFNGGEALLRHDIRTMIEETTKRQILAILMTNGLLLEQNWEALGDAGLRYVIISLDTLNEKTFAAQRGVSLKQTLRGVFAAMKLREKHPGTVIHLTSVLTKDTLPEMPALVSFCNEHQIWLEISVYDTYGQAEDRLSVQDETALRRFCEQMIAMRRADGYISSSEACFRHLPDFCIRKKRIPDGYRCYSGYGILLLDETLSVRPCWGVEGIGQLGEKDLAALWSGDMMEQRRRQMAEGYCAGCWNLCTEFNALCEELIKGSGDCEKNI